MVPLRGSLGVNPLAGCSGAGFAEKSLFPWFASRPLAQAKAAVICSLLPWPDDDNVSRSA